MRKILLLLFLPIIHFSVPMYTYSVFGIIVGRFIGEVGTPVMMFGEPRLSLENVDLPEPDLVKLKDGTDPVLMIPGLDFQEYYQGVWSDYKVDFKNAVLEALKGSKRSVYIYIYPSLVESYWTSGKRLVEMIERADLKDITIIAHSRGGLVARVALMYPGFRKRVRKVIFLATPHFGTPMSDALNVDPSEYEEHFDLSKEEADILRLSLVLSYTVGIPSSPGGKDMTWMDPNLPPFLEYDGVKFVFVAGYVNVRSFDELSKVVENTFKTKTFREGTGLTYLSIINELIAKTNGDFFPTDGLVPLKSALAYGRLRGEKFVFPGYSHAAICKDPEIIRMVLEK